MDEPRFTRQQLEEVGCAVFGALGAPPQIAGTVSTSLVLSNLLGHDSHGIVRLLQYSGWLANGQIRPAAEPEVVRQRGATAIVEANWGFGQPAARYATALAAEMARVHGVAVVTIRSCNHVGRLGEYVATLAEQGFMGMAFCNAGPAVAPFGGVGRVMGTNPLAWSAPRQAGEPIVLDFATSKVAEGKLNIARAEGRMVELGCVLDAGGRPSTDPNAFYDGGALLPFGAHKGSGLSILIELTAGLLSGMGASCAENYLGGNGLMLLAVDIEAFTTREDYLSEVERFCSDVKRLGVGPDGAEVLVPGEVEARTAARRAISGIRVAPKIRQEITELAHSCGAEIGGFRLESTVEAGT